MVAIQKYPHTSEALFSAAQIAKSQLPKESAMIEVHHHHHDYWGWGGGWYRPVYVYEGSDCSSRSERNDGYGFTAFVGGITSLAMFYFVGANAAECFNSYRALGRLPVEQKSVADELQAEPVLAAAMAGVFAKEKILLEHVSSQAMQLLIPKVALLASSVFTFFASTVCAPAAVGLGMSGMLVAGGIMLVQHGFYSQSAQIQSQAHALQYAVQSARAALT